MPIPHEKIRPATVRRILLAAAPWPLFNRPSIQLGTLKSYLNRQLPHINVITNHFYLKIAETLGYECYQAVSERTWLAESVYAAMLYPERVPELDKLFLKYAPANKALKNVTFQNLVERVKGASDEMISAVDWQSLELAGFTMSLCQLTSTLYFLKTIKKRHPDLTTVVGGSTFSNDSAPDYLKLFPDIDYIVIGEGERPLSRLIQNMRKNGSGKAEKRLEGVVDRSLLSNGLSCTKDQLNDLAVLPPPDYDEYFHAIRKFSPEKRFFPTLPVELSRGCWWKRASTPSKHQGCAFCNLNLQWNGYRKKGSRQVAREIDYLTSRHQVLSLAFMDNVLPHAKTGRLFSDLKRQGKDFKLFSEIRATTPFAMLRKMRAAGTVEVQVGIEALSSRLLKKMNKGTRAIQNLEVMRNCEALGIHNEANMILHFPGSDESDVAQTLQTIDYAMVFRPLKPVRFWLGLGSPVWRNYRSYQIKSRHNHPNYQILFPEEITKSCRLIVQYYRGDRLKQKKIWKPVLRKIQLWEKQYAALHRDPFADPILAYRDGKSFLMIHHRQYRAETIQHRLTGASRKIYLFCQKKRTFKQVRSAFPEFAEDRLVAFLRMMTSKYLMFEDGDAYLSLAVPLG